MVETLNQLITNHVAGCPVSGVKWTYLTISEMSVKLSELGHRTCEQVIRRLLTEQKFGRRKLSKVTTMKNDIPGRDEQFKKIARLKKYYLSHGYTVLSIDVKKKEVMGRFYREGPVWSDKKVPCYDHDFTSFSNGKVTPHGVYNLGLNIGFITLGQGADTAEFNVACLHRYWKKQGAENHKAGTPILMLLDGGGSNGSRNRLFKQEMQEWADKYGLNIRIAHYPPYCSKYNPIEHRLFPTITRAWKGVMIDDIKTMSALLLKRTTNLKSGLKIGVSILRKTFEKGVRVFDDYLDYCKIVHDKKLAKWNYRILAMP